MFKSLSIRSCSLWEYPHRIALVRWLTFIMARFMSLARLSVMGCHWFSSLCNIQGGGEVRLPIRFLPLLLCSSNLPMLWINECIDWLFCSQLKLTHPDHMLVKRASSGDESFERALQSVAWKLESFWGQEVNDFCNLQEKYMIDLKDCVC